MRGILHDFPDDKCRLILQNIIEAMAKDSLILIDEMVLPNTGVHWQATQIDLTMMSALASMERTHEQWNALLDSVRLKITKTYVYTPSLHESVMGCGAQISGDGWPLQRVHRSVRILIGPCGLLQRFYWSFGPWTT